VRQVEIIMSKELKKKLKPSFLGFLKGNKKIKKKPKKK